MWNPLNKKPEQKNSNSPLNYNSRVHIEHPAAEPLFQANLKYFLTQFYNPASPLIILCIGTDRSTGDSLGPLIGSKLKSSRLCSHQNIIVYGTLDEPVHAVNLRDIIDQINSKYLHPFIIAIDACLGRSESVGYVSIKEGPLQPGTGVNKELPAIGDIQIMGIVNVGGFMEYMVLQNTRLSLVMKMADLISQCLIRELQQIIIPEPGPTHSSILGPVLT
ncbi:MAG: spore protease YyaC [Firmicutes bacterium]|nr:spore protease YyaC [Bacillota bacterium]